MKRPNARIALAVAALGACVVLAAGLMFRVVASSSTATGWRDAPTQLHTSAASSATTGKGPPLPIYPADTWVSWSLYDRRNGFVTSGGGTGTNSTESMVKAAIAAEYLGAVAVEGRILTDSERAKLRGAIRDSDNDDAEALYRARGKDRALHRVISICGLLDTKLKQGWWSETQMSAADAARMGDCIADGRVAGPQWTPWLLDEMRKVRGEGRFGIIDTEPAAAIKNGWTWRVDGLHVNCLGITDTWSLAVLTHYPSSRGLAYGAVLCATIAASVTANVKD